MLYKDYPPTPAPVISAEFSEVTGGRTFVGFIESFLRADRVGVKADGSPFLSTFESPSTSATLSEVPSPIASLKRYKTWEKNGLVEAQRVATYLQ